jgi:hypothetical protein
VIVFPGASHFALTEPIGLESGAMTYDRYMKLIDSVVDIKV